MRREVQFAVLLLLTSIGLHVHAQKPAARDSRFIGPLQVKTSEKGHDSSLTDDDRLAVITAALDVKAESAESDCSHFVHAIYEEAGFPYAYAPSSELYAGVAGFQRIKKPATGDLVVWRGHVGIVTKPSQHKFFSVLSSGPGIDDYTAPYWKHRGKARFYRYLKAPARRSSPRLVRTNRGQAAASDEDPEQ